MRSKKALMNHVNRIHGDSKVDGSGEKVVEMTDCTKCDRQVKTSKLLLHYKRSHGCLPPGHEPGSFMCDQCPAELQSRVCNILILQAQVQAPKSGPLSPDPPKSSGSLILGSRSPGPQVLDPMSL